MLLLLLLQYLRLALLLLTVLEFLLPLLRLAFLLFGLLAALLLSFAVRFLLCLAPFELLESLLLA